MVANYYKDAGGISGLAENLARGLEKEGYRVRIHSVGGFWPLRLVKYLLLFLVAGSFDIIHAHCSSRLGFLPAVGALLAGKLRGRKLVMTYHDSPSTQPFIEGSWITRASVKHYSVVTTPAHDTARCFKVHGVPTKAIYNILELEGWPYRERIEFRPKLVWTRNRYRPELAIEAFRLLSVQYPEATLTMCGKVAKADRLREYRNLPGLALLGFVPRNRLGEILAQNDYYINTMDQDSFAYSVFEAMAMGLVVVSVHSNTLDSLAGSEVIAFSADDSPRALAQTLAGLIGDQEEARRRAARGREIVSQFTWSRLFPQWQAVYAEAVHAPEVARR